MENRDLFLRVFVILFAICVFIWMIYGSEIWLQLSPTNPPKGHLDGADCESVWGWSCDEDNYNNIVEVELFFENSLEGKKSRSGFYVNADSFIENNSAGGKCGGLVEKGFRMKTPIVYQDGKDYRVMAYAIDREGKMNPLLSGSGILINCKNSFSYKGFIDNASCDNVLGWACNPQNASEILDVIAVDSLTGEVIGSIQRADKEGNGVVESNCGDRNHAYRIIFQKNTTPGTEISVFVVKDKERVGELNLSKDANNICLASYGGKIDNGKKTKGQPCLEDSECEGVCFRSWWEILIDVEGVCGDYPHFSS